MYNSKTLCAVPLVEGFSDAAGGWRNCCCASPQIKSGKDVDFASWWNSTKLNNFRKQFGGDTLPAECSGCMVQEKAMGSSFRTAVNETVDLQNTKTDWPSRWNVHFGNVCNLACWSCNENNSSTIESHKRKLSLLSKNYVSSDDIFKKNWNDIKNNMLKSFMHHEFVTLTILGGEPLFNNLVVDFLNFLVENSLSHRTRLEFHTNATKFDAKIQNILLLDKWKYICVFLSLDSIGKKAEWLRYGCSWEKIKKNIPLIKQCANYLEVQCILSVLNISDLEELEQFCIENGLPLKVFPLSTPAFMSLASWDSDKNLFLHNIDVNHKKFKTYYEMLGSQPVDGMHNKLKNYIKSFEKIRRPLREFNKRLYDILFL